MPYYNNYRKADYYALQSDILTQIEESYHRHNSVDGYRSITVYLKKNGYHHSPTPIHKYMNTDPCLHSIVRPENPDYEHGKTHKVFENSLKQGYNADAVNCPDFAEFMFYAHKRKIVGRND